VLRSASGTPLGPSRRGTEESCSHSTIINDVLLQDPGVVERRVKRDVDKAIRDYELLTGDTGEVRIPLPRLIEAPLDTSKCYTEECKKLGGEMRLCSPWVDDCPKN
jgi:hypothetical protein